MFSFLFRIILFLVAISVIRGVVTFLRRLWFSFQSGRYEMAAPSAPPPNKQTGDTLLQQDPVCGTYVSVETSLKKLTGGRVYHFCSPECRERFVA
jgi:YHS domain-containing protein